MSERDETAALLRSGEALREDFKLRWILAEARVKELERELSEARLRVCTTVIGCGECERCRAVASETRLREALDDLLGEADKVTGGPGPGVNWKTPLRASVVRARAVLASAPSAVCATCGRDHNEYCSDAFHVVTPSAEPTPRDMRVAEAVREACVTAIRDCVCSARGCSGCSQCNGCDCPSAEPHRKSIRDLELAAMVAKAVGT